MKCLMLFISILTCGILTAQPSFITQFGGSSMETCNEAVVCEDGGYLLIGHTLSSGQGNWDVLCIKTDALGNEQWSQTYGGTNVDYGQSAIQTTDGGFAICGYTKSAAQGNFDVFIIKLTNGGSMEWSYLYGGAAADEAYAIAELPDGGFLVAGDTKSFGSGNFDAYLLRTDVNGSMIWARACGGSGVEIMRSVIVLDDGSYLMGGYTSSFGAGGNDMYLVNTDNNGNINWTKCFGGQQNEEINAMCSMSNGRIAIAGVTNGFSAGNYDAITMMADSTGSVMWSKRIGASSEDRLQSVCCTSDILYFLGNSSSSGAGQRDLWCVAMNTVGDTLWQSAYGGQDDDYGTAIHLARDSGLVMSGFSKSFTGNTDFFLVKSADTGNPGCATSPAPFDAIAITLQVDSGGTSMLGGASIAATPVAGNPNPATLTQCSACALPTAGFTLQANTMTYSFTATGSGAMSYLWDFGDGNTSALTNPVYVYTDTGTYNVCLTVSNACGNDSICTQIQVINTATASFTTPKQKLILYPNPAQDVLHIRSASGFETTEYRITDAGGRAVQMGIPDASIDLNGLSSGSYYLTVISSKLLLRAPFVIVR